MTKYPKKYQKKIRRVLKSELRFLRLMYEIHTVRAEIVFRSNVSIIVKVWVVSVTIKQLSATLTCSLHPTGKQKIITNRFFLQVVEKKCVIRMVKSFNFYLKLL